MAVVSSERLPMTTTTPMTVAEWMEKGLSHKDAVHKVNQKVFGDNYKRDSRGHPIEQGVGSAAQPTQQSIDAYRRYCQHEPDYAEHLKKMEADLAAFRARKVSKSGGDDE